MQKVSVMESRNEKIIEQKQKLAEDVLRVAKAALDDIEVSMGEAPIRDLISIFNSSIKVHRDLMSDIVAIQESESKAEKELAKSHEYTGKVEELLRKLGQSKDTQG